MSDSREVRLLSAPRGLPRAENFAVVQVPVPKPVAGEVLVRNRYFHVFAGLRTLLSGSVQDAPLPPVRPGEALVGAAVGEVVSAPPDSELQPGDLVSHWLGWREYAVVPTGQCTRLDPVLPDPIAYLTQARTAYNAVRQSALSGGETVFVSGGAGSVGSMAGRIARLLGAGRVIGSTSGPEKASRMRDELDYDDVVLRNGDPLADQLARVAPDGIDVMIDNVGGEQLAAGLESARVGARLVLVGSLSGQLDPAGHRPTVLELDSYRLILRQISLQGLRHTQPSDWTTQVGAWADQRRLTFPHVRIPGIEQALVALSDTMSGRYVGTVVVQL